MHILLPPSEGKRPGGTGRWDAGVGPLGSPRRRVAEALAETEPRPFGLSGERRLEALEANARLVLDAPVLPARERYDGVVYTHLDQGSLGTRAQRRAHDSLYVASGLGGVFGWDEPVPLYRVKMGARLGDLGRLDRFWRTQMAAELARLLTGTVIDLLPEEHAAAMTIPEGVEWYRVAIHGPTGRVGHDAKASKGRLVRALLMSSDPLDLVHHWSDGAFTTRVRRFSGGELT